MSKAKEVISLLEGSEDFESTLKEFVDHCQKIINDHFKKDYPNYSGDIPVLGTLVGKKYVRIIKKNHPTDEGGSAWAFIDKETGDVLKPASWAAPAKHARANIFKKDSWVNIDSYGPAYMR